MNDFDQPPGKLATPAVDTDFPAESEHNGEWLPLPAVIADSFLWTLDAPDLLPPLPLAALADAATAASLDKTLSGAYSEAVRRKLREALAHMTLPEALLRSLVRASAIDEVRAHLSRHGTPRSVQPSALTIADALPFIGRRPNRLLQCVDRNAAGGIDGGQAAVVLLNKKLLQSRHAAAERAAQNPSALSRNPFSVRNPLEAPLKWERKLRENAPDSVSVVLPDGASLSARDPRFGWVLLRIHGFVALHGQPWAALDAQIAGSISEGLVASWRWLGDALEAARRMTTAQETRALIEALLPRSAVQAPTTQILAGRYGLDGTDLTLEECAQPFEITRERVRQLQASFESKLIEISAYAPALTRFADSLESIPLCSLDALRHAASADLGGQTATGAIAAARAVVRKPAHGWVFTGAIYAPYGLTIACWSTNLAQPDILAILRASRAMVAKIGAFHVTTIAGDVGEELKAYVSRAEVEAAIDSCPQFRWISREAGWGTVEGRGEAPVFAEVRKMLAVAHPVSLDIAEIFAGLAVCRRQSMNRDPAARFGGGMPPPWVVKQLLEMQPDLEVAQYDNFKLKEALDPIGLIESEAEKTIYRAFVQLGGIASWRELRQTLVDTKVMNPITFGVILKSSSEFCQPGYGIYALRGLRFNIQKVWGKHGERDFARPALTARGVTVDEHSPDVMEFDVNQTTTTKDHRYVYAPAAALPRAVGTFLHQDTPERRIRISNQGQVARLAKELSEAGIQPRETIRLRLDIGLKTYTWQPKLT